jgi:membrane protease YdiL (CAAX protease family)
MTDTALTTPQRSGLAYIFKGEDGLRAGWSILLYLIFVALCVTILALIHPPHAPDPHKAMPPMTARGSIIGKAVEFAVFTLPAFLVSLIEKRSFECYGLRRQGLLPDLLKGMAWGVAMLSLLVGALWVSGALVFDGVALTPGSAIVYAAAWFLAFALVGLGEEFLTRGFLQYTLARGVAGIVRAISPANARARTIGFWVAALVFSVGVFAGAHLANGGETAMGIASVAIAGITFVYALYRTGSLWWAIGFHTTWDFMQSFFYGTHDSGLAVEGHLLLSHPVGGELISGGATGPEGSILLIPTMLLTIFIINRTLPRRSIAFDT